MILYVFCCCVVVGLFIAIFHFDVTKKKCIHCQEWIKKNATRCPSCGVEVPLR